MARPSSSVVAVLVAGCVLGAWPTLAAAQSGAGTKGGFSVSGPGWYGIQGAGGGSASYANTGGTGIGSAQGMKDSIPSCTGSGGTASDPAGAGGAGSGSSPTGAGSGAATGSGIASGCPTGVGAKSGAATAGAFSASSAGSTAGSSGAATATRGASDRGGMRGRCGAITTGNDVQRGRDHWSVWWLRNRDEFLWSETTFDRSATAAGGPLTGRGRRVDDPRAQRRATLYTTVVPRLLELLEADVDQVVRRELLLSLGCSVDEAFAPAVLDSLLPHLADTSLSVQASATLALGLLGSEDAAEPLLALATDGQAGRNLAGGAVPDALRPVAALALGLLDAPAAVGPLMDLVARLPEGERDVRVAAVTALGLMRNAESPMAAAFLASTLRDRRLDPEVGAAIPVALARLQHAAALDPLLDVLRDRDTDRLVRQSIVLALGQLGSFANADVVDELCDVNEDDRDAPTRRFALLALARLGAAVTDPAAHARQLDSLARRLGKQVNDPRLDADRAWAALAAGLFLRGRPEHADRLLPRLVEAYEDVKDPSERGAYALALGLARAGAEVVAVLEDLDEVNDEEFRGHAAVALGLAGVRDAAPQLLALALRPGATDELRHSAAVGLHLLGEASAARVLQEAFTEAGSFANRSGLAAALAGLRDGTTLPVLTDALSDDALDPASRAQACAALGVVSEKTTLPWQARLAMGSNPLAMEGVEAQLASLY